MKKEKKNRDKKAKKIARAPNAKTANLQKFMTCGDYARHRGVTFQAVYKAIKSGRIRSTEFNQTTYVEVESADKDWNNNTKSQHVPEKQSLEPGSMGTNDEEDDPEQIEIDADGIDGKNASENRRIAEAKKAVWDARQAELDFLKESGELVEMKTIKKEAFELARIVRDAILNIPDRISAELVGIKDQAAMHSVLTRELTKALQEFVDRDLTKADSENAVEPQ